MNFDINTAEQVTGASALVNGTSATVASGITYAPFGPHTGIAFGNGLADARTFDTRYRLGTWTLGSLISKTYAWQDDDNITGITDNLNATNNRTFGYDAIHRLTSPVTGPWGAGSYSYDANGNRTSKTEGVTSVAYTYTAGTNRLAAATGSEPGTYGYDANGNTTGDGAHTYQFSQRDRLATADSGTTGTYSYDGDGRRVQKTTGGVTTLFFYDSDGKLLEEYIPATGAGKDYVWLPGTYEPLARVDFSLAETDNGDVLRVTKASPNVHLDWSLDATSGPFVLKRSLSFTFSNPAYLGPAQSAKTFDDGVLGNGLNYAYEAFRRTLTDTLYYYHADHLGTPIAMTNSAGAFVWRAEHTPFGGIYALTVGTIANNLRFPGQYYDSEAGLAQNYFRDYRHNLGRYWEPDPLSSFAVRQPLYLYARNAPSKFVDPTGLLARVCCRLINMGGLHAGPGRHCYIWIDGHTWGLYPTDTSHGRIGVPFKDRAEDKGGSCADTPMCPGQNKCIAKTAQGYPQGSYATTGPNSNTFASAVAKQCGLNTPAVANGWDAPGWGDAPPSP